VKPLKDFTVVTKDKAVFQMLSDDMLDSFIYTVFFEPFSIEQRVNDVVTLLINSESTLFFENASFFHSASNSPSSL